MKDIKFGHYGENVVREIEATFNPKIIKTLRPSVVPKIGKRFIFTYAWTMTEEDGGDYVGQPVFYVLNGDLYGWTPLEDLDDIKVIE